MSITSYKNNDIGAGFLSMINRPLEIPVLKPALHFFERKKFDIRKK